ncbi:hypothetical protein IIE18_10285 [Pseudomonas sp. V1]|uniref:hypothetical protein n=1 Tax=Pseudomonas arcuscaelestis TaxID=2710591 RepID=UPI00193EEA69|nr:hypothetical protein [Pseudomonas arcuscaelestis]MBM3105527.1 hypothetical protein [Pseudomonas arcuscaelestis]
MNVTYPTHCGTFSNWHPDDSTTLIVLISPAGVQLQHLDTNRIGAFMTCASLSNAEALDVAGRLNQALRGERASNPGDDEERPHLLVTRTTDGEPYRDGISLSIDTSDWNRDFDFPMSTGTAHDLANLLMQAKDFVEPAAA